jgi:tetratricopeptide (TPR) repeat protein
VIGVLIGWAVFNVSPLQPLEEISFKQREYKRKEEQNEYRKRMVIRHLKLANSFLNVSQLEAAKIEFENALKLDPGNEDAHFGKLKAEVFEPIVNKDYDPEIAEKRLNLLLQERPNDPHIFVFLGDVYRNISHEQALTFYKKASSVDPSVAAAYIGMATIYDMDKNSGEAIRMYEKALELSNWNQTYLNNLGYQYLQRKNYKEAINKYELLLKLDYRYLLTYYTLSSAHRLIGNLDHSYWYQKRLITLLDDAKVVSLPCNQGVWFFHTDSRVVYFYDYPMRKCYAYYSAALTAHLKNDGGAANMYVNKGKALKIENEWLVKELIRFDIKNLKEANKEYTKSLSDFIEKYF